MPDIRAVLNRAKSSSTGVGLPWMRRPKEEEKKMEGGGKGERGKERGVKGHQIEPTLYKQLRAAGMFNWPNNTKLAGVEEGPHVLFRMTWRLASAIPVKLLAILGSQLSRIIGQVNWRVQL